MECKVCGTENKVDAKFCMSCGSSLTEEKVEINNDNNIEESQTASNISTDNVAQVTQNTMPPHKNKTGLIIAIVAIIVPL